MLRSFLRHEWRTLASDSTLWLVLAVFSAAIAYGTFNGARWAAFQRAALAEAHEEEASRHALHEAAIVRINREQLTVSSYADPRNPDAVGRGLGSRYAVLPATPLAALTIGQGDLLPSYFRMTTDAKETVLAAAELENPQRLLTGRFDLAFVLIYLYPLLILALTYNLLSAEKEQGTLVLALSQPISLRTFILGKIAIRFAVFLVGTVVLCGAAIVVTGIDGGAPGVPPRLGLWLASVACYGLFWFAVATATAALGKPSATNAIILAGAWLVLVVFLPSMLNVIATTMYPVPSRVEMIQAMRVASDRANEQGSVLLAKYYEDHPELASGDAEQAMNDFNMVRMLISADVDRQVTPVLDRYRVQLDRQQQLVALARYISPAILMQDALNDVSGTGTPRHRAFMNQVGAYHQGWRDYFTELVVNRRRLPDFAGIPRFVWTEERLGEVARRVTLSLTGLVVPAGLLAAVGLALLRRYPVVA